ncbi:MAG: hypothetical protein HDR22_04415 [Lachnospiraceae bacterium]|nr:hypothetical protein [Lachnospiraceae bacterium]
MAGIGILRVFAGVKVTELYKKKCCNMIADVVTLASVAFINYFGKLIKVILPVNILLLLLLVQVPYIGIRKYVKVWREARDISKTINLHEIFIISCYASFIKKERRNKYGNDASNYRTLQVF